MIYENGTPRTYPESTSDDHDALRIRRHATLRDCAMDRRREIALGEASNRRSNSACQGGLFGLGIHALRSRRLCTKGTAEDTAPFNKDLYLRWLQYGVFQPVYRPHAQEHMPHRNPYSTIARHAASLRDFMQVALPHAALYLHAGLGELARRGMPLMRPAVFRRSSPFR